MGDELQARIRVRELQNTGNNSCVSCLGWRWHRGKKTVFMPRCSSAQRSVASAWREKRKQVVSRVRGICDDVTCPFLHSGVVQILKAGQVHTNDPSCCPNSPLQSSYIFLFDKNTVKAVILWNIFTIKIAVFYFNRFHDRNKLHFKIY